MRRIAAIPLAIAKGASIALFVFILGVGALAVVVPALVGGAPLTILTGSMSPTLPPGALAIVKPKPIEEIQVGDVLTFQLESGRPELVTHRVVARTIDSGSNEVRFTTQGDANSVADIDEVRPEQVRGTVWYGIPWLGWANTAVNGEARAWLVPLVAGCLFAYAAWSIASGLLSHGQRHRAAQGHSADSE